ncbi:putative exported domain protein [Bacteroides fragilis str. S6L3]|nr:putative exported domain protein [Bacteroides fragilis str. S6L3]
MPSLPAKRMVTLAGGALSVGTATSSFCEQLANAAIAHIDNKIFLTFIL